MGVAPACEWGRVDCGRGLRWGVLRGVSLEVGVGGRVLSRGGGDEGGLCPAWVCSGVCREAEKVLIEGGEGDRV